MEPVKQKVPKKIWDGPDAENCLEKTAETTFFTTKWGTFWAAYEMIGFSRPTTVGGVASRFLYWTAPAAGIGFTYAATTCMMGKMRGKDDFVNHSVAAVAASSFVGMRYGQRAGWTLAVAAAIVLGIAKETKRSGLDLAPKTTIHKDMGFNFDHDKRYYGPKFFKHEVKEPTDY